MSNEKFAKGEWIFACDDLIGVKDESDTQSYGMVNAICYIDKYDFPDDYKANAHLIAAAPEMYGLLKRLLNGGCLVYGEDIDSVEDLLAKARGES